MKLFWLKMAESQVNFALRMRKMGKQFRLELAPWPELADDAKAGCGCFGLARRALKEARTSRYLAQIWTTGEEQP